MTLSLDRFNNQWLSVSYTRRNGDAETTVIENAEKIVELEDTIECTRSLAIANRSRVSCAHSTSRAFIVTL